MRCVRLLMLVLFLSACNHFSSQQQESPDYEKMADRITAITANKIKATTGLNLCRIGGGMMNHIRMMAMSFDCYNEINMEQGRELVVYCVNEYLLAINSNEEIRPYLVHYPFTPEDIEIGIYIHKQNHQDVSMGALSVVSEEKGKVVYRIKQPKLLKRVHEETYEEAIKILETGGPINKIRRNTTPKQLTATATYGLEGYIDKDGELK